MPSEETRGEVLSLPKKRIFHSFDEVAKGLASGSVSRRDALRWMGGVLVGTVVASVPGVALIQRAAEAALSSCQNASACCSCTYFDEITGEVIKSTCETEVGRRCGGRRIQRFFSECEQRCEARRPPGANAVVSASCEGEPDLRSVCRRRETGEKFCRVRSCQ